MAAEDSLFSYCISFCSAKLILEKRGETAFSGETKVGID